LISVNYVVIQTHTYFHLNLLFHYISLPTIRILNFSILAALNLLQKMKTVAIIGPQTSSQAVIISEIGNKSQVPVISFSATSPTLSSIQVPYFIRTAINDAEQVYTITALIKVYGWQEVVPIYQNTNFGRDFVPYLADALQEIDVRIPYHSLINESSTDDQIQKELYKLQTMQTRVFVVHMTPSKGSTLFLNAKEVGMMSKGYVWIMTNGVMNVIDTFNPKVASSMEGTLGIRQYTPKTEELENFTTRWRKIFQEDSGEVDGHCEISTFALWAYDTIYSLAMAVEKVWTKNANFSMQFPMDHNYSVHLPVFPDGPKLLNAISNINFRGLSGNFELKDGQLQSSVFEIINVVRDGIRQIAYSRGQQGLTTHISASNDKTSSTLPSDLNPVIWPGESKIIPKGWEVPVSERKLRVGVFKSSYKDFMQVDEDPVTHAIIPSGYAVDVFEAAIKRLPYAVPYEYELYGVVSDVSSLTYNDFVYQVYLQVSYICFTKPFFCGNMFQLTLVKHLLERVYLRNHLSSTSLFFPFIFELKSLIPYIYRSMI
jgi:glutamate receptor, ionotropic, plant